MAERQDDDRLESLQAAAEEDILSASDDAVMEEGTSVRVRALFASALRGHGYSPGGARLAPTRRSPRQRRPASIKAETHARQAPPLRAAFGPPQDPDDDDPDPDLRPKRR